MRRRRGLSLLAGVFLLISPMGAQAAHGGGKREPSAAEASVVKFAADFAAAVRSQNVARIMGFYLKSADLVIFDEMRSPGEYRGWEACRQNWQQFFLNMERLERWETSDLQAKASGGLGYYSANWLLERTFGGGGRQTEGGRLTQVVQKVDGQWRIIHEHLSRNNGPIVGVGIGPGGAPKPEPPQYANPNKKGDGKSGVEGVAMAGPVHGGPTRLGEEESRPLPNALITIQPATGGLEIARQRTDAKGRFRIPLTPGAYRLVPLPPQPGARLPRGAEQTVTITAGKFSAVTVDYDTGLR